MRTQDSIIGQSTALATALECLSDLAAINRPVLIVGERGTGKELAAERLHFLSPRWEAPYIKVNCAAMAESLLESELFGHEPGAFTGATQRRRGRFERADGGTLFLDELATTSARLQEKLLRLVEYGEFERLGGQETLQVDVRVIAATHADLPALAAQHRFRHDLLDRLSFDVLHIPALRQRGEDIEELAQHFAVQMSAELGWPLFPGFTSKALTALLAHSWPGNIRELKNAVERSVYRWAQPEQPVDAVVIDPFASPFGSPSPADHALPSPAREETTAMAPRASAPSLPLDLRRHLHDEERRQVEASLAKNSYNQKKAAEALSLSYYALRGLVRKHGLQTRKPRRAA
ncbi:MAG: phage shock protein operon transcriptional activator [Chromatocurvus sp.]